MRIVGLHLRAYGHFTDYSLDFGAKPGLHLVYGDNEAGKSTALRALSSVLFGYPSHVIDGFKHDAKDITIGADLIAQDGRTLSYVRKRRGKSALANADGTILDEAAVASFLGGISRDIFEKVFALDHHRLHEHAKALLSEGGSLGFSLAEAGSGIAGLKAVLDRLRGERAALFLSGGSKPKLNQLITRLTELRKEARRRAVSPGEYKRRQNEIDEVESALSEARDKTKSIQMAVRKLERIARNLPLRTQYEALSLKIEGLSSVPLLPPEAAQHRIKAQTDHDTAEADLAAADDEMGTLQSRITAIVLDTKTLDHRPEIERLTAQRAVIANAELHLPKREAERSQHYATARDLLTKGELSGTPEHLDKMLPSALKRKAISTLADAGTKLNAQIATAMANVESAEEALSRAKQQAEQIAKPADIGSLAQTLSATEKLGEVSSEICRRKLDLATKSQRLAQTIVGLGITDGSEAKLREVAVPSEKAVTRYKESLAAVDEEISAARTTQNHLNQGLDKLESRIATLKTGGVVASEEDLKAARRLRDDGWALVRGIYIDKQAGLDDHAKAYAPKGNLSNIYEARVVEADKVADAILADVEETTELSLLERQKSEAVAKIAAIVGEQAKMLERRSTLLSEWRTLWPTEIVTAQLPNEMYEWLKTRLLALSEVENQTKEQSEISALEGKESGAIKGLVTALNGLAPAHASDGLNVLQDRARKLLDDVNAAVAKYGMVNEAVETQAQNKSRAEKAAATLKTQITEWKEKWGATLKEAGLSPILSIESVTVVLDIMNSLDGSKIQIDNLTHRIKAMMDDKIDFEKAIDGLKPLLPDPGEAGPLDISRQLEANLETAKAADAELKALRGQLETRVLAREQALEKLRRSNTELASLCAQAGGVDAKDLAAMEIKSAEKAEAIRDRDKLETRLREDGAGLDLDALLAECDGVIGDQVPGEISTLSNDSVELEARIDEMMTRRATLSAEFASLFANNQAADIMQDAANAETEIDEAVQAYADLTVQETLLRQAIDLYRDRNQGPILTRAKSLFAELTNGEYTGLRADVDENGAPILLAEHASRGSLEVSALSDGTVDPLYLALRFAVVQEHNATHEPLPFIADDLLLNLDNRRARATLKTLATVASSAQVLFFTHHEHMIELARTSVPQALLVEHCLPPPAA
jgi:uncharacterized protein YhaN